MSLQSAESKSQIYHCPTWVLSLHKCSLSLPKWAVIPPYFRHWMQEKIV